MLRDVLVLHWGSVVAWLRAEVASVVLEQPERDYPYYGINAAEGQKQAVLLLVDRQLVVAEIVTAHQRHGAPDDATMVLSFHRVGDDGFPGETIVTYTQDIANSITERPGGEDVTWTLPEPFTLYPDEPVFMMFTGNWTPNADGHVRVYGGQGGDQPFPRCLWKTDAGWTWYENDSLFFQFIGYEYDDPAFATNPDTSVVIAERIFNPANIRAHLARSSDGG